MVVLATPVVAIVAALGVGVVATLAVVAMAGVTAVMGVGVVATLAVVATAGVMAAMGVAEVPIAVMVIMGVARGRPLFTP